MDFEKTVDKIRIFLQSDDQTRTDSLAELASVYADACVQINDRLHRCEMFLRQGLRSEALHLVEAEPNLLEATAVLDFPEAEAWRELVFTYDLAKAPPIQVEIAEALNEVFALEHPLQDLMHKHRRLAMGRCPLPQRIAVMRSIAELDPDNAIWSEDIRTFEKARLRQLDEETRQAIEGRDLAALEQILGELESQKWGEKPPSPLFQKAKNARSQLRQAHARRGLGAAEAVLNEAHMAMDVAKGHDARRQWEKLAGQAGLSSADPARERVEPAIQWLDEHGEREARESDYKGAVGELETALDEGADGIELERLFHKAALFERGVPEALELRFRSQMEIQRTAASRRYKLIAIATAAGVLMAGGLALLFIQRQSVARDVEQAVAAVNPLLQAGEIEQASSILRKLESVSPGLFRAPEMVDLAARVRSGEAKASERSSRFRQALQDAESVAIEVAEPPSLEEARSLARMPEEKAAVDRATRRRELAFRQARAKQDEAIMPRLEEVGSRIAQAEAQLRGGSEDLEAILDGIRSSLRGLSAGLSLSSETVRDSAAVHQKRVDTILKEIDRRREVEKFETLITRSLPDATRGNPAGFSPFADALQEFIRTFPSSARAGTIKRVLGERPSWEAALAWSDLVASWKGEVARMHGPVAKARVDQCSKWLVAHPDSASSADVLAYRRFAEAIARREEGEANARDRLLKLFSDELVDNIWMVTLKDANGSKRLYLRDRDKVDYSREPVQLRYIMDFTGREQVKTAMSRDFTAREMSPQWEIGSFVKERMSNDAAVASWESTLISILRRIQEDLEIDPLLQITLLDKVLSVATDGSVPLQSALTAHKKAITLAGIDPAIAWMDPDNRDAIRLRPKASDVVKRLPSFAEALKSAGQELEKIAGRVIAAPSPVGWLAMDDPGWRCLAAKFPGDGELLCISPAADGKGVWVRVGLVSGGKAELSASNPGALAEGRPVFFRKSADLSKNR